MMNSWLEFWRMLFIIRSISSSWVSLRPRRDTRHVAITAPNAKPLRRVYEKDRTKSMYVDRVDEEDLVSISKHPLNIPRGILNFFSNANQQNFFLRARWYKCTQNCQRPWPKCRRPTLNISNNIKNQLLSTTNYTSGKPVFFCT
jgi:hypothetical protein